MKKPKVSKSAFQTVLDESLKAYADCHDEVKDDNARNLDFKASLPVTGAEYVAIMKRCTPNGYNEFSAVAVENVRALFGDEAEYYIAREGSPCVYVVAKSYTWLDRKVRLQDLKADEVRFEGKDTFRIWWD